MCQLLRFGKQLPRAETIIPGIKRPLQILNVINMFVVLYLYKYTGNITHTRR